MKTVLIITGICLAIYVIISKLAKKEYKEQSKESLHEVLRRFKETDKEY